MQNCRIQFGTVRSRPGTTAVIGAEGKVTAIFNWLTPSGSNLVLYQDANQIKVYDFATSTAILAGLTCRAPSFAPLDVWTYICGYDTAGNGTMPVQIYGGGTPPQLDPAFRAPPSITTWTATDLVAGVCTAGTRLFGFVYQNRTGYLGKPVIADSLNNPFTITSAANRQIKIDITLPPQTDGGASAFGGTQATLSLIATRTDNNALWYFIPTDTQTGQVGVLPVPLNVSTSMTFVINLPDEDIAADLAGDTAQANFLFTQPTVNPGFVVAYGNRMCYGAGTKLYVSDIGEPQQIAEDRNVVRMQNQKAIGYAFQLPGNTNLYLTGDFWTGYVTDNSDSPATWAQPVQVSGALGAPLPNLVCAETGGNYVWIVTEAGPYLFDGSYADNPLTYLNSGLDERGLPVGWSRVNWSANYSIQIKDDVKNLRLYIAVPMDGSTEPNFMFVIDYRMGKTFETCDISLDVFTPQLFSSIGIVKEQSIGLTNLWMGPSQNGAITRLDETSHNDPGGLIDSYWKSGLVRNGELASAMIRVGALDIWSRGDSPLDGTQSTLGIAVISQDEQTFYTPELQSLMGVPAALVPQPGLQYSAKLDLARIYNFTVTFRTAAIDNWFELSSLTVWVRQDLTNR